MVAKSSVAVLNVDDYAPGLYARTQSLAASRLRSIGSHHRRSRRSSWSPNTTRPWFCLDVNLPDMHGFEVCRRIRMNPALAATTILHISASNIQEQHQVRGLDTGADGYLVEPVDPAVLMATVKAFLRARQAENALRRSNEELERFAYRVSHELNEPLRTITMHGQLLENRLAGTWIRTLPDPSSSCRTACAACAPSSTICCVIRSRRMPGSDVRLLDFGTVLGEALISGGGDSGKRSEDYSRSAAGVDCRFQIRARAAKPDQQCD